ncbi:MAG: hypothetical protein BWY74_00384 [Firmicutes bacterium ADurb.Bin419]|nr:MAG: hypothetical protein BWY74_00384 [Firmicutes bacterium ADurb.Bin419]
MTAEIGIMNRYGIALAADSAVTIGDQKVFNTANKLFALSKFHPVGIMVYGNGAFMDVPWEIIIKSYRKQLSNEKKSYLQEYAEDFMSYLFSNRKFSTDESEKVYVGRTFISYYDNLLEVANKKIIDMNIMSPTQENLIGALHDIIIQNLEKFEGYEALAGFDDEFLRQFYEKYEDHVENIIKSRVDFELPKAIIDELKRFCALILSKNVFANYSGVVIAGFGEEDIFPRLYEYEVEGKILGRRRYKLRKTTIIEAENTQNSTIVSINPFAQQEMVHSFVEGIDPYLKYQMFRLVEQFTSQLPIIIEDILKQTNSIELKPEDKQGIEQLGNDILTSIKDSFDKYKQAKYVIPLIDAVATLPKEELAALAEALINLTSIKRKMTINIETVGGPIDVAIITKGDGFIWIKRKHYFQPELNHSFFKNYMWGDTHDSCKFLNRD